MSKKVKPWWDSMMPSERMKPSSSELRKYIGADCAYCGDAMDENPRLGSKWKSLSRMKYPTRDHIIPRSAGMSLADNKIIVCRECNHIKGDRDLQDFLIGLIRGRPTPRNIEMIRRIKMLLSARREL
jgi:hypothetical protein